MTPSFHSEHGEDRWIFENLKLPEKGVYVDIGCAHPVDSSNTAFLRELGWAGVAIDANPQWAPDWKNGDFVCAVLSDQRKARWRVNPFGHPYASRIDPNAPEVDAITAEEVLREKKIYIVDLLSIDVEGHELPILRTIDFAHHLPAIIIVEYNTEGLGENCDAANWLSSIGYRPAKITENNFIMNLP